ncbi:hypothetical protein [Novosphingobium sp. CECT 9465]|nr:hypothetical protein [Novosphingobium sp. CECT 9465]
MTVDIVGKIGASIIPADWQALSRITVDAPPILLTPSQQIA